MRLLRGVRTSLQRLREGGASRSSLDGLLSRASPADPLEVRLHWPSRPEA